MEIHPHTLTHGAEANHSGKALEMAIEYEFRARGIPVANYADDGDNLNMFEPRRLIKHVTYRSVAPGLVSKSEFVYRDSPRLLDVRIECKSQGETGSCDEKLSFLLDNAIESMPEPNIWIVLDGHGFRKSIVNWVKLRAKRATHKNIRVMTLLEAKLAIKRMLQGGPA